MKTERFLELQRAGEPIFIENEIEETVYDFTKYPHIRVKSRSGKVVEREYDKSYRADVDTLLYGKEIDEERFNSYR